MASSNNAATGLDCLKYIIDTAVANKEKGTITDVADTMLRNVTKSTHITATCTEDAVKYAKSIISSQDVMLTRLRSRIQELPEHLGWRSNFEIHRYCVDERGEGWDNEKAMQTPVEEGEPFRRASQLVKLIEEKNSRENEIEILQLELERRLRVAVTDRWIPKGLRDV